ncbi:hypothetical protein [Salegentibacter holothuriorum]|uniref:hypothetical protein n=1 Tax=Salegentibacter holothuriorum TaxID=241145 RepID=UPI0009A60207|nr:hypothetical protein [Salegentibacter holothuriorum]
MGRWRDPVSVPYVVLAAFGDLAGFRLSTGFVGVGFFLRLLALAFRYNLPDFFFCGFPVSGVQLSVRVDDLFVIRGYFGFDAEVSVFVSSFTAVGVDSGTFARSRLVIFGLAVAFFVVDHDNATFDWFCLRVMVSVLVFVLC